MRVLTKSTKLPEFDLPLIVEGNPAQLDLTCLIHEDDKRGFLRLLSKSLSETPLEIIVKPLVLGFKAYLPDYKFSSDYLNDNNFQILVDKLKDFLYEDFEKDIQKNNSDSYLQFKMQEMALRSKALLKVVDDLYFSPRSDKEAISPDLRKLFIYAHRAAQNDLIYAKNLLSKDDPHIASSRFEGFTGKTLHYNLYLDQPVSIDQRLRVFVPVRIEELNWKDESLNQLKELFKLDENEASAIVQYLSMFSDDHLLMEGYARPVTRQPYINVSGIILDKTVSPSFSDPDLKDMPLSTVIHEITHILLKEKYPNILKPNPGLVGSSAENRTFNLSFNNKKDYPLTDIEELICFALTIHINPLSTVAKLAAAEPGNGRVPKNYAAPIDYAKYLSERFKLYDSSTWDQALKKIKLDSLDLARACIKILDDYSQK